MTRLIVGKEKKFSEVDNPLNADMQPTFCRLFPNGGEGGSGSELTDKTQAPAHPFHPKMTIRRGVLASECSDAMQQFFQLRRKQKEKKPDTPAPPSCLPISNHPSKFMTKMHGIFHMFCL